MKLQNAEKSSPQKIATIFLIAAFLFFLITTYYKQNYTWIGILAAMAEGSLVGGLADWFAVVVLFRHPFGIPLPHTAILPAKKKELGDRLGKFISQHFLETKILQTRFHEAKVAEKILIWFIKEKTHNKQALAIGSAELAKILLQEKKLRNFLTTNTIELVKFGINNKPIAPPLGKLLQEIIRLKLHNQFITYLIKIIDASIVNFLPSMEKKFYELIPDMLKFLREPIFKALMVKIYQLLKEIEEDKKHPVRKNIETELKLLAQGLIDDPEKNTQIVNFLQELLNNKKINQQYQKWAEKNWQDLAEKLEKVVQKPTENNEANKQDKSKLIHQFNETTKDAIEIILTNTKILNSLNQKVANFLAQIITTWDDKIRAFFAQEIDNWNTDKATAIIEEKISGDLQWIRINGTVIGGLAGGGIYLISKLISSL